MDEIASMLVSSPKSFDFEYVKQINADQQVNLLCHFEQIYDNYSESQPIISEILPSIEFGASAKNQFVIQGNRYEKFHFLRVNRVTDAHHLIKLADDYKSYPAFIDLILQDILQAKGQGTKIAEAIKRRPELSGMFEFNIPQAIEQVDPETDAVSLARNISKTQATVEPKYYDILESYILMSVLSDDLKVKTQTANKHMKNIKKAEVSSV